MMTHQTLSLEKYWKLFPATFILIEVEVKYDHSFDKNFDARQMCVKSVMALAIHLILDKQEGKCDLNLDSTFDARQRSNQICYGVAKRSNMSITLTTVLTHVKGVRFQRQHVFAYL